jgi:hypothetical protein
MTLKDRTNEFNVLAESIKAKKLTTVSKRIKKTQEKSNFSNIATQIGLGIASTTEKLERLTKCKLLQLSLTSCRWRSVQIAMKDQNRVFIARERSHLMSILHTNCIGDYIRVFFGDHANPATT